MPPIFLNVLLLLLLLLLLVPSPSTADDAISDILRRNNLPIGLLPRSVKSFRIDEGGSFEVVLDAPCTARFENEVRYEANVSGAISYGQIGALRGVSAHELFLWFPVKGIRVKEESSGVVFFDVGVVNKPLSRWLFETPPECRRVVEGDGHGALAEGYTAARIVSESQSGKLRYALDNDTPTSAIM